MQTGSYRMAGPAAALLLAACYPAANGDSDTDEQTIPAVEAVQVGQDDVGASGAQVFRADRSGRHRDTHGAGHPGALDVGQVVADVDGRAVLAQGLALGGSVAPAWPSFSPFA